MLAKKFLPKYTKKKKKKKLALRYPGLHMAGAMAESEGVSGRRVTISPPVVWPSGWPTSRDRNAAFVSCTTAHLSPGILFM